MRVLIYGAGVIGSLYAALFSEAGVDTSVYARGAQLETLRRSGLRYEKNGAVCTANVCVLDTLHLGDIYDFIFLTVRENQLHEALAQLRENQSPCVVTMVNSIENYDIWEQLCGNGRILPAFPGARKNALGRNRTPAKSRRSYMNTARTLFSPTVCSRPCFPSARHCLSSWRSALRRNIPGSAKRRAWTLTAA